MFKIFLAFLYVVSGCISYILATHSSVIDRTGGVHSSPSRSLYK